MLFLEMEIHGNSEAELKKKNRNICLINYEYPPIGGGAANATYFMAREFVKQSINTAVITAAFKEKRGLIVEEGIKVFRVRSKRKKKAQSNIVEMISFLFYSFLASFKIIKKNNISFIIAFFTIPSGILSLLLKKIFRIQYIISLRGGDVPGHVPELSNMHSKLKILRQLILKNAAFIIANSNYLKELSEKTDPYNVIVIPNGVDIEYFKNKTTFFQNNEFNLLYVGRLHKEKNVEAILMQLSELIISHKIKIHIVGDGEEKENLMEIADKIKINNNVVWYGWCEKEKIKQIYQLSDCLINPSLYEGMPNVVLEAMSTGIPVIASKVPGNESVVKHNETGFLFDLKEPEKIKIYIEYLINNRKQLQILGNNARKWVEQDFSWKIVADEYYNLMNK